MLRLARPKLPKAASGISLRLLPTFPLLPSRRKQRQHIGKVGPSSFAAAHRPGKANVPNTPAIRSRSQAFRDVNVVSDFPHQTSPRTIRRHNEGITYVRLDCRPVGDHAQPKTIDFDVVQDGKTVVHGCS